MVYECQPKAWGVVMEDLIHNKTGCEVELVKLTVNNRNGFLKKKMECQ